MPGMLRLASGRGICDRLRPNRQGAAHAPAAQVAVVRHGMEALLQSTILGRREASFAALVVLLLGVSCKARSGEAPPRPPAATTASAREAGTGPAVQEAGAGTTTQAGSTPAECYRRAGAALAGGVSAAAWLRARPDLECACDGAIAEACGALGASYESDGAEPRDDERASALFKRGCELGDAWGCTNYGTSLSKGRGLPRDLAESHRVYRRGCDLGDGIACTDAAVQLGLGRLGAPDLAGAKALFRRGCDLGDQPACRQLASLEDPAAPVQSPQESARAAFSAQRFEEVCQYLVAARFSPEVCDYLARTARGVRAPPPRMDAWLASQGVRLLNGVIVGPEDPSRNEYEVLVGGEPTLLIAEFTQMENDLIEFEFWAQEIGSREVKMASGRMRALPLYREWPLYVALVDIDRFEGDQRAGAARELLEHLVGEWERLYAAPPGAPPPSTPPPADAEAPPATTTACAFPRAA
jgi:hypothetical protein